MQLFCIWPGTRYPTVQRTAEGAPKAANVSTTRGQYQAQNGQGLTQEMNMNLIYAGTEIKFV